MLEAVRDAAERFQIDFDLHRMMKISDAMLCLKHSKQQGAGMSEIKYQHLIKNHKHKFYLPFNGPVPRSGEFIDIHDQLNGKTPGIVEWVVDYVSWSCSPVAELTAHVHVEPAARSGET